MALAFTHLTQGRSTSEPVTTASISPPAGAAVLLTVAAHRSTLDATTPDDLLTVTGLSGTWTKLATGTFSTRGRAWLYSGTGLSGSGAITIDYTGAGTIASITHNVDQVTGQNDTPLSNIATNSGTGENHTVSTTGTPGTDDATYSSVATVNFSNLSPEAGWSALGLGQDNGPRVESAYDATSPIDTSCTWTTGDITNEYRSFIGIVQAAKAPTFGSIVATDGAERGNTPINVPGGVGANSLVLVGLYIESDTAVTPPSGFTQVGFAENNTAGSEHRWYLFWHRATTTESGTYVFGHSNAWTSGTATRIDGAITSGSPFDATSSFAATTTNANEAPNVSLTTVTADTFLFYGACNFNGGTTYTPPGGYTERADVAEYTIASASLATAGATGNVSATANGSGAQSAFLAAIKPAVAGGGSEAKSAADAPTVSLTEATTLAAASTVTDTPTVSLTEAAALAAASTVTDTPTVSLTEAVTLGAASTVTDTPAVSLTEAATVSIAISASDTLTVSTPETATVTPSETDKTATDTVRVSTPETTTQAITVTAADTVAASLAETTSTAGATSASDTLAPRITDTATASVVFSAADSIVVALTESATAAALNQITAADTVSASLSETSSIGALLVAWIVFEGAQHHGSTNESIPGSSGSIDSVAVGVGSLEG